MRFLRIMLVLVFVVMTVFFAVHNLSGKNPAAAEGPVLSCSDDVLLISVKDSRSALLRGVTATDAQDGDLFDEIIISGVSKLIDDATAKVTYVVMDSDNNMATLTRQVRYKDYQSPRFSLEEPLLYTSTQNVSLTDRLHAEDSIDGDITHNIRVSYMEATDEPNVYTMDAKVTNSMGDTVELTLPVMVQDSGDHMRCLELTDYLVYLKRGSGFVPENFISEEMWADETLLPEEVVISGRVNTNVPGTYYLSYSTVNEAVTGTVVLTVVVE